MKGPKVKKAKRNPNVYSGGYSTIKDLRAAARKHGASELEFLSIDRLEAFTATDADIKRLAPLAKRAGLPWSEMFPESNPARKPRKRNPGRKPARNPSAEDIAAARREYRRSHWGEGGPDQEPRILEMADPGAETFVVLGELTHVVYETSKGHEGIVPWEHKFDDPPLLVYGKETKRLGIAGGSYTVGRAGIKG